MGEEDFLRNMANQYPETLGFFLSPGNRPVAGLPHVHNKRGRQATAVKAITDFANSLINEGHDEVFVALALAGAASQALSKAYAVPPRHTS